MAPLGIAVVGAGPWGLTLARALGRVEQADLRWICDLDEGRLAAATGLAARVTTRLDDVLADPDVAAVAVAVDLPAHHPVGLRVLRSRRHLLLEKPMASSAAEGRELLAAAAEAERLLTVGDLLLHHPVVRRVQKLTAEGVLGDAIYFASTRATPGPARAAGSTWWALAPHDVSLALSLLGALPVGVSAVGGAYTAPDHDNIASATLQFSGGRTAHLRVARFAGEKQRRFSLAGTRRTVTFDEIDEARPLAVWDGKGVETLPASALEAVDPLLSQCRAFVTSAVRGEVGAGNGEHALAVVRVLEAGARSMRLGGQPVEVA
jgi:predicted dehydrogenase